MKPFNLEEAKAGKPVCTRDGRRVEIISFENPSNNNYPILAKVFSVKMIMKYLPLQKVERFSLLVKNMKQI